MEALRRSLDSVSGDGEPQGVRGTHGETSGNGAAKVAVRRHRAVGARRIAATLVAATLPFAQSRPASTLEPALIARVNQIYPGFTETLEVCEPISLERLSRVLSENPGRDSLAVSLAVLESCPAWSASDWSGNRSLSRLGTVVRTVGELPLAPVARMLRTGTLDQRTMAAALLGGFSNLVPVGDRGALEQAFIAALSDPDMHVRELIVGRLRLLGPGPAGQAAIDRSVADPECEPYISGGRRCRPTTAPIW